MMSQAKCLAWQNTFPVAVLYPAHVFLPYKATKHRLDVKSPLLNGKVCTEHSEGAAATEASWEPQSASLGKLVVSEDPLHSPTV